MAPVASSSKATTSKPYDRSNTKGKGKATVGALSANIGAPAQWGQKSRKGKKAWRKHVDITGEEEALEQAREEERVTGGRIADKKDTELFVVDTVGDVQVAQKLRRTVKPLRSLAILSERSAIPSLTSCATAQPSSRKTKISSAEKARLRRIARRELVGVDGSGGLGSADIKPTTPINRDAWVETKPDIPAGGFGEETMNRPIVKAPKTITRQRQIYLSSQVQNGRGVELPEEGTSYNPSAESHAHLIGLAYEEEKARLAKEAEDEERIKTLGQVVIARRQTTTKGGEDAPGMKVGDGEVDSDEEPQTEDVAVKSKKPTKRKTQAQRNKTLRLRESARLAQLETTQTRLLKSIGGLGTLKADLKKKAAAQAEADRLAKLVNKEKERLGLEGGEKVGKHRVPKGRVAVQLGEDLAETLRQVKPEGNLFKDRFMALQKKALVEPRVPQLPKRKVLRTKEYEKHAYKRFA